MTKINTQIVCSFIFVVFLVTITGTVVGASPYAYVTNEGSNTVSVIDTATNTVSATVEVGVGPEGVAVNPAGTKVYVANYNSGTVSIIDTATNTVTATVPVGYGPCGIAVNPAGTRVYVVNCNYDGTVSVIDTTTNTVTATVPVGVNPIGVAVSSDGTKIYVTNSWLNDNSVSVIDTATNTVIATMNGFNEPVGVAVTPDGTKLYVANMGTYNDTVSVIDTGTKTAIAMVNVKHYPYAVTVTPNGKKVYVASQDSRHNVSVIDTATNTVIAQLSLGGSSKHPSIGYGESPEKVAISPDGNKVYVSNEHSDSVSVIDTATNTVIATVDVGIGPAGVAVCPVSQSVTSGSLVQIEGHPEVYLIKDGLKCHFTSSEALLWNGYTFDEVINVTSETLQKYPDGKDISVSQAIIDKYNALGGAPIFGAPDGKGEKTGDPDSAGTYCSYVNFESGSIEYFQNGDLKGRAYAIFNPFYKKWASMGYAKSVLGYPIDNMSDVQTSKFETPFRYQNFANGTEKGALEYNITSGNVFEIHGAIFAKWGAIGYAKGIVGLVTSDEKVADISPLGTTGKYSEFENGCIHWISNKEGENVGHSQRGKSFVTYGDLNEMYDEMGGTGSELGFPIKDQETKADGHDYCEFEGGKIEWDDSTGTYKVNLPVTNTPPTTNPVSVTNTESSTPTISWTYSDADNDPQQQYELEVWTEMGGTGTNMWSTSQSSMYTSIKYGGSTLDYGNTYYVRVKAFDGTDWSEWSETSWNWIIDDTSSLSVKITSPSYEDKLIEDESTRFSCQVSGGVPPYTYEWRDGSGDIFSDLQNFDFNFYDFYDDNIKKFQPSGINDIRLTVIDATGAKGSDNVQVYVVPPPAQVEVAVYQDGKLVNNPIMNKPYEFRIKIKNVDDKPHYYSLKLKTPPEDNAPDDYIWDINPITTEIQNNVETQLIQPGETNVFTYSFKSNWVWITPEDKISRETMNAIAEVIIPTLGDIWNIEDIFEILTGNMVAQPKITFKFKPDELSSSQSIIYEGSSANAEVYVGNDKTIAFYEYLTDRSIELVGSLAAANTGNIYVFFSSPAAWIYSKYHYQKAIDPDPDYKVVVNPEPYNVPEIDSLPDGLHKDLARVSFEMLSYNRAEVLSYVRYIAAEEANAHEYELLQLEAVKKYNDMYLEKIDTINNIYRLIIQDQSPLTDVDVANIKNEINTNGLPIEWISILTREGLENEIPNIKQAILDADNEIYKNPSLYIDNNVRDAELRANLSEEYAKEILEIKVNDLGKIPTEASPMEIGKLEKLKTDIQLGLDEGYATKQLKDDIKSMLDSANTLISETNNNNYLHYYSFAINSQVKYLTLQTPIKAEVTFDPETFNLNSTGDWVTAYIELPAGYSVSGIDISSVLLNGTVHAVSDPKYDFVTNESEYLTDLDLDGISERMFKFNRGEVAGILKAGDKVTVTFTGKVEYNNGISSGMASFEGSDVIKVTKKDSKK